MKTSEELHALHKELWGWLAKTGTGKSEWPGWLNNGEVLSLYSACFACLEATIRELNLIDSSDSDCEKLCPIDWGPMATWCARGSAYMSWMSAETKKTRKKYAAIIRDLPWSPRPEGKP